jgi:uncharacterized protein (TIGR02246 family)
MIARWALLLVGTLVSPSSSGADEADAIREARARSNRAIAARDLEALTALFAEQVVVVTSRSARSQGREAERAAFAAEFRNKPDVSYVREPDQIDVFAPWEMGAERGRWRGQWSEPDGRVEIGGSYFAKWRKVEGRWLIEAEVFVPDFCRGSRYCDAVP